MIMNITFTYTFLVLKLTRCFYCIWCICQSLISGHAIVIHFVCSWWITILIYKVVNVTWIISTIWWSLGCLRRCLSHIILLGIWLWTLTLEPEFAEGVFELLEDSLSELFAFTLTLNFTGFSAETRGENCNSNVPRLSVPKPVVTSASLPRAIASTVVL